MIKKSLSDLPVRLKLEEDEYDLKYQEELKFDESTIDEDLKKQPSYFAWYSVLYAMAEDALGKAKLDLELLEANLDPFYRLKLTEGGKVTEPMVASAIKTDDKYIEAIYKVTELKKAVGILKAIKEAFDHRREMLLALASNMRSQIKNPELLLKMRQIQEKGNLGVA